MSDVRDVLRCQSCRVLVMVEAVAFEWPHGQAPQRTLTGQCRRCERIASDTRTEPGYSGVVLCFPGHAGLRDLSSEIGHA